MNDALQQLVRNWLIKAGNDLKIGRDEMKTAEPTTDMVCYHMQQCVEKCLKLKFVTLMIFTCPPARKRSPAYK